MFRSNTQRPFIVFVTQNTFTCNQVWICSAPAIGFKCTVKIDHQMIFCSSFNNPMIPVHHFLVFAVHEINFNTGNSPFFIQSTSLLKIKPVNIGIVHPKPAAYIFVFGILQNFGHVNLRRWLFNISIRFIERTIPLPVDKHVWPTHFRSQIDVLINHGLFHFYFPTPPVVPGTDTWFYPRWIFNFTWVIQVLYDFRFHKFSGSFTNHYYPPWGFMGCFENNFVSVLLLTFSWRQCSS